MSIVQPLNHRHPELVSGSISRLSRTKRWQAQPNRQIGPMRVMFVDQVDLPRSMPVLQLLFAFYRGLHFTKQLKMDKAIHRVFRAISRQCVIPMLPHATDKVRGNANVKRAIQLARKDIDAGLLFLSHVRSLAAKWTLKQVQGDKNFEGSFHQPRHPELVSGSIRNLAQVGIVRTKVPAQ